ncbi:MAG: hypothetical protein ACYDGR_00795 [Candidatus Dormibacteria bacterium]
MTLKFLKSKPGLALFGASGMIAVAAFAGTTVVSHAADPTTPSQITQTKQAEPADTTEAPAKSGAASVDADGAAGPNDQSGAQDGPNDQSGVDGVE